MSLVTFPLMSALLLTTPVPLCFAGRAVDAPCLAVFANISNACYGESDRFGDTTGEICGMLSEAHCTCFEAQCSSEGIQYSDVLNCHPGNLTCELLPGRGNVIVNATRDGRPPAIVVPAMTSIWVPSDGTAGGT